MSIRISRILQITKQVSKLVLFRRLRNPWMLVMLGLVFAGMSGAFASLGVPFLFWHDNSFARMFGLMGVGVFIEEWVYVAMLLDADEKNPAKRVDRTDSESPAMGSDLPATAYVEETLQIVKDDKEILPDSENQTVGEQVFRHTRQLHTYASFSLCIVVSLVSYLIFSWNDLPTTSYYLKHIYMMLSGVYFSVTGAFFVFLIRKLLNRGFADPQSWISRLFSKSSFVLDTDDVKDPEFKRLHQIAFGKNVCFGFILLVFCVAFWSFQAAPSSTVPVSIVLGCVALLIYLWMLVKTDKGSKGRIVSIAFTVVHLLVIPAIYFFNSDDVATSVALIGSVLLTLLVGFFGWIVFQSRRLWFEYVVFGALILCALAYLNLHRVPQVVEMYDSVEAISINTEQALAQVAASARESSKDEHKQWRAQFKSDTEPDSKPVLVVIANSGGGIKAQVWSSVVIHALEKTINEHLESRDDAARNKRFQHHVRLVTGTSGGMVGASHWVASLGRHDLNDEQGTGLAPEEMVYAMTRDALDDVSRQLFYNDLIAFPYNVVTGNVRTDARGKALEAAFEAHSSLFEKTLSSLKEGEDEGWRPILAFAPAVAEDGRRFLISNQPIEYTLVSDIPSVVDDREQPLENSDEPEATSNNESSESQNSAGVPVYTSVAGYSWRVNYAEDKIGKPNELRLSQAARLSANFPIFVDSPKLPFFDPPLRLMDAGYVDNYGVVIANQWLQNNLQWLKDNTSKVLIVQISASPLERHTSIADEMLKAPETLGFLSTSFNKTLHHTDMALARFARRYNENGGNCRIVTFEYQGDAALTWYLSNKEKFSLLYPFLSNETISELGGTTDNSRLAPFEISKDKSLYKKIVANEGKRFVTRVELANRRTDSASENQKKLDRKYLKQRQSRQLIRQKLQAIKAWWDE